MNLPITLEGEEPKEVPAGMVLVPIVATPRMVEAGYERDPDGSRWMQRPADSWRCMVEAAIRETKK